MAGPQPSSPTSLPSWHFPFGPSSRYHQREGTKSIHTRMNSTYTPTAPKLSTAARAHRRTRSSASDVFSSPSLDRQIARNPLSRNASSTNAASVNRSLPVTPAKSPPRSRLLDDSPFSDYFTDDSVRSSFQDDVPSSELQHLLVRILKLQSQLMRGDTQSNQAAIRIIDRKLGEIETDLCAESAQPKSDDKNHHFLDSGIFVEEQDEEADETFTAQEDTPLAKHTVLPSPPLTVDGDTAAAQDQPALFRRPSPATDDLPSDSTSLDSDGDGIPDAQHQRGYVDAELQGLLTNLTSLQTELRQRHTEMRDLATTHSAQLAERDERIEQLRTENELLRSDLGFEYSELLFLKLQMKGLELQVGSGGGGSSSDDDEGDRDDDRARGWARLSRPSRAAVRRNRILGEMEAWRGDWADVDARFRRRRSGYGAAAAGSVGDGRGLPWTRETEAKNGEREGTEEVAKEETAAEEWRLETKNEARGRVTSVTIMRVRSGMRSPSREANAPEDVRASEEAETQPFPTATVDEVSKRGAESVPSTDVVENISILRVDQGTQTAEPVEKQASVQASSVDKEADKAEEEGYNDDIDDCAVTSSSETDVSDDEEDVPTPTQTQSTARKTAWEELCESLTNLAGMGNDRF